MDETVAGHPHKIHIYISLGKEVAALTLFCFDVLTMWPNRTAGLLA